MVSAFNKYVDQRSLILMTMSILNSCLSDMPVSPIEFFVRLEPYSKLLRVCQSEALLTDPETVGRKRRRGRSLEERSSIATHSVEALNKYLQSNPLNSAILQQMLALLMQVYMPLDQCIAITQN